MCRICWVLWMHRTIMYTCHWSTYQRFWDENSVSSFRFWISKPSMALVILPEIGTRSRIDSAFRILYKDKATTCSHQKMSFVSQLQVTDVILHLKMKMQQRQNHQWLAWLCIISTKSVNVYIRLANNIFDTWWKFLFHIQPPGHDKQIVLCVLNKKGTYINPV